jgi:hypothetical protein
MKLRLPILGLMTASAAGLLACAAMADPPGRVGRISYLDGEVSFQPPEQDFWTDASVNFPVAAGEAFWTGDSGRAALQIGSTDASLDSETELDVTALRYGETRLAMSQGSLNLAVHNAPPGGIAVSTPAGDVLIDQGGFYRIDVGAPQDDGSYPPVEVTVFDGAAQAPGPSGYMPVSAGEAAVLYAGADPELQDAQDTAIDDWSRGHADFEHQAALRSRAAALPEAMTGARDLGGYGDFVSTPDYGTVWFPTDVPPDWAPYRFGYWSFVSPWGYTWIDDQPWGFAPFHYGRWALIDGRWGWIPGQPTREPIYAPALVAFIGGAGWSVGLGGDGGDALGWVPLAPDEVYRPPYEVSDAYLRGVNVANVTTTTISNITVNTTINAMEVNNYRNARAVTVVRADAISRGVSVQKAVVPVSAEALARAPAARPALAAPPRPQAGTGVARSPGAPGEIRGAAAPPARLKAVRAAVAAPAPAAGKPPMIAGATLAPRPPRAAGAAPAKALIAPAQVKHPAAQGRQPTAAPRAPSPTPLKPTAETPPASPERVHRPTAPAPAAEPVAKSPPVTKSAPVTKSPPAAKSPPTTKPAPAAEPPAPPTAAGAAQAKAAQDAKAKQRAAEAAKKRTADQAAGKPPQP